MGKIDVERLEKIFEKANKNFLRNNRLLIESEVSERTLCGALMIEINDIICNSEDFKGYFVDIEYNRNRGNDIYPHKKMCKSLDGEVSAITCDLVVHSRGQNIKNDNLIELEMKKRRTEEVKRDSDRERLKKITKPLDECWIKKGKLPPYVCGYKLGIYYEIDFNAKLIQIEYYCAGNKQQVKVIDYEGNLFKKYTYE